MKKILFFIFPFIIYSCNYFIQLSFDEKLSQGINLKYSQTQKPVDLSYINDFKWDNYLIIGCYENPEIVAKKNNLDLKNIYKNPIVYSDTFLLLVFLKDNNSVKICKLNSNTKISEKKQFNRK